MFSLKAQSIIGNGLIIIASLLFLVAFVYWPAVYATWVIFLLAGIIKPSEREELKEKYKNKLFAIIFTSVIICLTILTISYFI